MNAQLKIGDTLYRFDGNRRVYVPHGKDGRASGGPIYREHFEALKIIGENKVSWLLERGWKANKKSLSSAAAEQYGGRGFFTAEGMEDDIWQHDHKHKIVDRLQRNCDGVTLRKVAELIGYQP